MTAGPISLNSRAEATVSRDGVSVVWAVRRNPNNILTDRAKRKGVLKVPDIFCSFGWGKEHPGWWLKITKPPKRVTGIT
jgi:hypothetical protein